MSCNYNFQNSREKINILRSIEKEHNLCELTKMLVNDEIPDFYNIIMIDPYLTEESRKDFINNFWIYYESDIEFRKNVLEKYLFFFNKKFMGILNSSDETENYGKQSDNKFIVKISNDYKTMYNCHHLVNYKNGTHLNSFKVEGKVSNTNDKKTEEIFFKNTLLIDTGCTITEFFNYDYYDFTNKIFKEKNNYTNEINKNALLLNEYIFNDSIIKVATATESIYLREIRFKYPLYIKIGNLKPIPMYVFSFQILKTKTPEYILLGLDYLSNIKLTLQPYIDSELKLCDEDICMTLEDLD